MDPFGILRKFAFYGILLGIVEEKRSGKGHARCTALDRAEGHHGGLAFFGCRHKGDHLGLKAVFTKCADQIGEAVGTPDTVESAAVL